MPYLEAIMISVNSLQKSLSTIQDQVLSTLRTIDKRILIVATIIFATIAALYIIGYCMFSRGKKNDTPPPKPPLISNTKDKKVTEKNIFSRTQIEKKDPTASNSMKAEKALNTANQNLNQSTPQPPVKHPKTPLEIEAESDPEKKQLLEEFGAPMVLALGGLDKMKALPVYLLPNSKDFSISALTAPVMKVKCPDGLPRLAFCYYKENGSTKEFERYAELLVHSPKGWRAECFETEPELCDENLIEGFAEKVMAERIARLMKHEPVGCLVRFKFIRSGKLLVRVCPTDSMLNADQMTQYLKSNPYLYEQKPSGKTTNLYLCNRSKIDDVD